MCGRSASRSCDTHSGDSFMSQILMAQVALATLSSTPFSPPKIDCTSVIRAKVK